MRLRALLGFGALVSACAVPLGAADPFWANSGPQGASVTCVAADPGDANVVFLCAENGGIFKSDDGGQSWRPVNQGLGALQVLTVAVSPAGGVVLAGTETGMFRTVNGGESWTPAAGPPASPIAAIVFNPESPATVYAGSTSDWLGRSADGGATWQPLASPAVAQGPSAIALQPGNPATVYVGTADGGVFRSDNSGGTWVERNEGLDNLHVSALAIDPTEPARVIAGTVNGGAFLSTDGGASWSFFSSGIGSLFVGAVAVDAAGVAYLGNNAGVFQSFPGVPAWSRLPTFATFVNGIALGPGTPGRLFVGFGNPPVAFGGIVRSEDRTTFFRTESGLNAQSISSLAVDPTLPSRVLAVSLDGGWESLNSGATWAFFSLPATFGTILAFDPASPGVVYQASANGVWRSVNGGENWTVAASGLPDAVVRTILPLAGPARVLAGTLEGLYRSDDAGATWVSATDDLASVYWLDEDPFSDALWAGTADGVYRSVNGGSGWTRSGANVGGIVRAVLASSLTAQRVVAGAEAGVYVSQNDGGAWTQAAGVPGPVYALAEDATTGDLYAGTGSGVYVGRNGGASWSVAAPGLTNPQVRTLTFAGDGTLLAGTFGGSVFRLVEPVEPEDRGAVRLPQPRTSGTRVVPPRP